MILTNNLQRQNGNFLVIVSFIATSFVLFFGIFSYIARSYLVGQENSELSVQAAYAAESILEQLPYGYNKNDASNPAITVSQPAKLCKNYNLTLFGANVDQAIIDFGKNCETGIEIGSGRSKILKKATRMTQEESGYLDRYQLFEYRLTRNEFLEQKEQNSWYPKPDHLRITWWNDTKQENPKIELILASWEKGVNTTMSSNIAVQRVVPQTTINSTFEPSTGKNTFDLYDLSSNKEKIPLFCITNCSNDYKDKEYILFVKSFDKPLHFTINGISSGSDATALPIPSRFLFLETNAIVENEQNPLKDITRTFKSQKEFYTDLDSNFPYAKYEIR